MEDKIIKCKDCGQEFTFTVGEQEFYKQRELFTPVRCKSCRKARKLEGPELDIKVFASAGKVNIS